jgi:hypothetical protein
VLFFARAVDVAQGDAEVFGDGDFNGGGVHIR